MRGSGALDWDLMSNSLGPRLRLLRNALAARSVAVSEPFGLPHGSLTVLILIRGNPGWSQTELAQWSGITSPALVGVIDELERRGLVKRERSEQDRRRNKVVLTEKGNRTIETLFKEVNKIEQPIREELGEKDTRQLLNLVDRALLALKDDGFEPR
jgi:DNA-binding MarR family transcriptional regulator